MNRYLLLPILFCLGGVLAACAAPTPVPVPTAPHFPTVTPGRLARAAVPPPDFAAADPGAPAAVIAAARQPTATPDRATCPPSDSARTLVPPAPAPALLDAAIVAFLSDGGTAPALEAGLAAWGVTDGQTAVRADLDLTGEGVNEWIVRFRAGQEGVLLIVGCLNGRAIDGYRAALTESIPDLIETGDANRDGAPDLLFAAQTCPSGSACVYRGQMVTYSRERGRFVNLISDTLVSPERPAWRDINGDGLNEVVAAIPDPGSPSLGPVRTGFTAWAWDGASYVRGVTQLDPPRYRIQAIHEADAAFDDGDYETAIGLYQRAADDSGLESWLPDDDVTLRAYALYRLLVAYAAADDPRAEGVQARIVADYPDPLLAPPYALLALEFWNGYDVTGSASAGCGEALEAAATRLDAIGLLNRYGSESPVYNAAALCPL